MKGTFQLVLFVIMTAMWANFFYALTPSAGIVRVALLGFALSAALWATTAYLRGSAPRGKLDVNLHMRRDEDPGDAWKRSDE